MDLAIWACQGIGLILLPCISDAEMEAATSADEPKELPVEKSSSAASGQQEVTKPQSDSSPAPQSAKSTPVSREPLSKPVAAVEPVKQDFKRSSLKSETPPASKDSSVSKVSFDTKDSSVSRVSFEAKDSGVPKVSFDSKDSSVTKAPLDSMDSGVSRVSFDAKKPDAASDSGLKTAPSKAAEFVKRGSLSESPRVLPSPLSSAAAGGEQSGSSKSDTTAEASLPSMGAKPKVDYLSHSVKYSSSQDADLSSRRSSQPDLDSMASTRIVIAATAAGSASSSITSAPSSSTPSSSSASVSSAAPASSPVESKKESLRQTDSKSSAAFSPKDDYKLRRQNRSKTLPEQPISKDEQFAIKVQRAASHRVEATSSQTASPETSPRHGEKKVVESSQSKEPEWFALARKKTGRQESEEKNESPSPTKETVSVKGPASAVSDTSTTDGATPAAKVEPAAKSVDHASNMTVSSASSKFEQLRETKQGEMSRMRGGSVKTSPTKTNVLANRGGSVKVASGRPELGSSAVSASPLLLKTSAASSAVSSSSTPAARLEGTKEEAKSSDSSPTRDVPKWKIQSAKTPSAYSSSTPPSTTTSAVSSSRFPSVKTFSHSPTPSATSSTKTEPKPTSPVKRPPLSKAASEEERVSVPAWRANLTPKKPGASDIKIELIESAPSRSNTSNSGSSKKEEVTKRQEPSTKVSTLPGRCLEEGHLQVFICTICFCLSQIYFFCGRNWLVKDSKHQKQQQTKDEFIR